MTRGAFLARGLVVVNALWLVTRETERAVGHQRCHRICIVACVAPHMRVHRRRVGLGHLAALVTRYARSRGDMVISVAIRTRRDLRRAQQSYLLAVTVHARRGGMCVMKQIDLSSSRRRVLDRHAHRHRHGAIHVLRTMAHRTIGVTGRLMVADLTSARRLERKALTAPGGVAVQTVEIGVSIMGKGILGGCLEELEREPRRLRLDRRPNSPEDGLQSHRSRC